MKTLGIIGYGDFGQMLANKLDKYFDLKVYSASGKMNRWSVTLEEVAKTDYLILSLPLSKHKEVCEQLKPHLGSSTVIVDVCSVKGESGKIIKHALPEQAILSTHPLFGPQSIKNGLEGHVVVLCPDYSDEHSLQKAKIFLKKIGLEIVVIESDEHDKQMALVHGLTFFVARILKDFNLSDASLKTPSFNKLISLAELEKHHSKDLFITIEKGNPHTEEVRKHFIDRAIELNNLLSKEIIPE